MDVAMLERSIEAMDKVVAGTSRDQLDAPTPCTEWSVRDLLNHCISLSHSVVAGASGEVQDFEGTDFTTGDYVEEYRSASRSLLDAFSAPGALQRKFTLPWGDMPGDALIGIAVADVVVHAWDLAKATNQDPGIDQELAEAVHAQSVRMLAPNGPFPRGESFGDPVDVPDDAAVVDRMVAYMGRRP